MLGLWLRIFKKNKKTATSGFQQEQRKQRDTSQCQICHSMAPYLDTVDFNKSCEEIRGKRLPISGVQIDYYLCDECGFCFAPLLHDWTAEEFASLIYNEDYELVDPDYKAARPLNNAELIEQLFGTSKGQLKHLDYGGGSGLLSDTLRKKGWDSKSYDPFVNVDEAVTDLGQYDLITAFEVFEHVPDVAMLLNNLHALCKPGGLLLFSTLLSDNEIEHGRALSWWYASPRNGHISLFTFESLRRCLATKRLMLGSFSANLHIACEQLPSWAAHLVRKPSVE